MCLCLCIANEWLLLPISVKLHVFYFMLSFLLDQCSEYMLWLKPQNNMCFFIFLFFSFFLFCFLVLRTVRVLHVLVRLVRVLHVLVSLESSSPQPLLPLSILGIVSHMSVLAGLDYDPTILCFLCNWDNRCTLLFWLRWGSHEVFA